MQLKKVLLPAAIVFLIFSCAKPQDLLLKAINSDDIVAAVKAIENGADLNLKNDDGFTPLMRAAAGSESEMVDRLLYAAGKQNQSIESGNMERSFKLAAEENTGKVQAVFHEHFAEKTNVSNSRRYIYNDGGLDLLKFPDAESTDIEQHLDNETEVSIQERSIFPIETASGQAYWMKVIVDVNGSRITGWLYNTNLTEMKGGRLVRYENEHRIIDAYDGLNIRENPDLDQATIMTLPGGAYVDLLAEFGEEITLAGTTGRWSLVEWRNTKGWVFGGFLRRPSGEPDLYLSTYEPFLARNRIPDRIDGLFYDEELEILEGNKVKYIKTNRSEGGFDVFTHSGYYFFDNDRIHFVFRAGTVETFMEMSYESAYELIPVEARVQPQADFSLECIVIEQDGKMGPAFIELWKWQRIQSEPGKYEWNRDDNQFTNEAESVYDLEYFGYFQQTSG